MGTALGLGLHKGSGMGQNKQVGIQVARAIAALSIVYYHSWTSIVRFPEGTAYQIPGLTTYGWFAVYLFFAISGYVICLVVSRETFQVQSFLIKRVFRLYPLWLIMLSVFAVTAWLWRGLQPFETLGYFLYSATLLPTLNYPFYNVGWSLQPEIAFYLIVAVVVPLLGLRGLAVFLLVSTLAAHLIDVPWYLAYLGRYYGLFLAGVLAFMAHDKMARFGFWGPAVAGVVLLVLLGYLGDAFMPFGLFFVISAFANLAPSEQAWWRKPATKLGDASYSIYLIHPMVFFTASSLVSKFPNAPLWVEEPIRFICIGIAIALSLLSWRLFETPMIRLGNRLASLRSNRRPVEKLASQVADISVHDAEERDGRGRRVGRLSS
jgi:exopolysaccharide production protein ExoZ